MPSLLLQHRRHQGFMAQVGGPGGTVAGAATRASRECGDSNQALDGKAGTVLCANADLHAAHVLCADKVSRVCQGACILRWTE